MGKYAFPPPPLSAECRQQSRCHQAPGCWCMLTEAKLWPLLVSLTVRQGWCAPQLIAILHCYTKYSARRFKILGKWVLLCSPFYPHRWERVR